MREEKSQINAGTREDVFIKRSWKIQRPTLLGVATELLIGRRTLMIDGAWSEALMGSAFISNGVNMARAEAKFKTNMKLNQCYLCIA